MKTKLRVILVAATVIVALAACFSPLGPLNIGELSVALSAPTSRGFSGDATPVTVASFRLTISATDMETVTATAAVGESALVVAVAAGTGRTVTLEALAGSGTVLYRGATTVDVQGGVQADVVIDMQKLFSEELQGVVLSLSDNPNFLSEAPSEIDFQAVVGDEIPALFDTADPMKLGVPVPWFVDASSLTLQFTVGTGSTLEYSGTTAADGIVTLDLTSSQQVNVVAPDDTNTPYTIEAVPSVDASSLISDISAAQALHDGADEGLNAGEYSSGSKAIFLGAINAAVGFFDVSFLSKDSVDLTTATSTLASAQSAFHASQNGAVIVSPSSISTTEGGSKGTLSLVLGDAPTADVTVSADAGTTDASLSVSAITFTSTNWNTSQEIVLTANDDGVANGTRTGTVSFTVTSTDTRYDGAIIADVTLTVIDNDSPAVSVGATSLSATEAGAAPAYDLVLTSQPTADVTIALTAASGNATISTSTVTFNSGNWATPQTVTVTAVDDLVDYGTGPRLETITHVVTSADTDYDGFTVPDVSVDVYDDDVAGVTVSTAAVSTTEGGGTQTFTVVLDSEPTADVTVDLTSSLLATTISPTTLIFTNLDWSASQTVTVSAVDDAIANGTRADSIQFAVTSGDTIYSGMVAPSVTSIINDDEVAQVVLGATSIFADEYGPDGSYSVVLASAPVDDVTVTVSNSSGNVMYSPSTLTFTAANWNTQQSVMVTAIPDGMVTGTRFDAMTHTVSSASPAYSGIPVPDVSVTVQDFDFVLSWNTNDSFSPGPGDDVNAVLFGTPPTSGTYSNGTVAPIPTAADGPFLQGYKLTGWNTSPDGSGTSYAPGSSITMWANTTLYAQWAGGPGNFAAAFSGGDGSAGIPYEFSSAAELYNIGHRGLIDQGLFFKQTANIDLGVAPWNSGGGWPGIEIAGITAMNPTIEGTGFVISNMTINRPGLYAGLISRAEGVNIIGLALENVSISSDAGFAGAILGDNNSLNGGDSLIQDSYATGTITIDDTMFGGPADTDDRAVGGLVGYGRRTSIINSFADVTVISTGDMIGGLAGYTRNYIDGGDDIVENSYSLGDVTGNDKVGGLVGESDAPIRTSYAAGLVSGVTNVGGLVGIYTTTPSVLASYYDTTVTGQSDVGNGAPVASVGMVQQTTFQPGTNNWDFSTIWAISEGASYPYHQWWTGAAPVP